MDEKPESGENILTTKNIIALILLALLVLTAGWYFIFPRIVWGMDSCMIDHSIQFGKVTNITGCGHEIGIEVENIAANTNPDSLILTMLSLDGKYLVKGIGQKNINSGLMYSFSMNSFGVQKLQSFYTESQTVIDKEKGKIYYMSLWFSDAGENDVNVKIVFNSKEE